MSLQQWLYELAAKWDVSPSMIQPEGSSQASALGLMCDILHVERSTEHGVWIIFTASRRRRPGRWTWRLARKYWYITKKR